MVSVPVPIRVSIHFSVARALLLAAVLAAPAGAQQSDGEASKAPPKAHHVFTNDDMGGDDSQASGSRSSNSQSRQSQSSDDGLPSIPGLIKCGTDVECFLQALDKKTPASVTRDERLEMGGVTLSSNSLWWTTRIDSDQVVLSLRLYAFDAKVGEDSPLPQAARDMVESKMAEVSRNFESVRGKTGTCLLAIKDVKALMRSQWTLMSLGQTTNSGKSCSGPAFEDENGPLSTSQ